jgi:hypothetical protein
MEAERESRAGPGTVGKVRRHSALVGLVTCTLLTCVDARAQDLATPPLFASHEVLPATLTADFRALKDDRIESPDRPALITVMGPDGNAVEIKAELRTRGEFRLDPINCSFPPLRLDVDATTAMGTVLEGQDDLKLVSSCRPGRSSYTQLVLTEYLAYRAYAIITDRSYSVRLLRLTFVDTSGEDEPATRTGFAIEEDDALAARLGAEVFDLEEGKNLPPTAFDPVTTTMTAVFSYMIGNPDWSDVAGHNVEILDRAGTALAVPYDFDFSGLVDAPYATPPPEFGLRSVRERYYRGWCANSLTTRLVLQRFRDTREDVLTLFETLVELDDDTRGRAVRYLEAFYDDIETDERAERRFLRDCRRQSA